MGWKILGGLMLLDGLLLALFGHQYLERVRFDFAPRGYQRFIDWQIEQPEWIMRLAGAIESGLGVLVARR